MSVKKDKDKEIVFKGKIIRSVFSNDDYRIYAVDVDKTKYPDIKFTKYGNAIISGEIHELGEGIEYEVTAVEEYTKNGYGYKVKNIKRNRPTSQLDVLTFLEEILTPNQAREIYSVYPDIVDKVIQNDLDDIDLNRLKGIKEYTFNNIKNKIIENFCLVDLVTEFQGMLSLPIIKKLYDKYTSVQIIKKKMREDPYKCLCGLARIGFKTADSILLEMETISKENIQNGKPPILGFEIELKESKSRCLACILYLLEKNEEEGHTMMSLIELRKQCTKLVPACSNYFVDCIKDDSIYYDKEKMIVCKKNTYDTECYICNRIIEGLKINNKWNYDFNKYKTVNNFELSEEQIRIVKYICDYNICILNGAGGSGKSFSTQAVINMLEDNGKSYKLFSPTGKAAKILAEYTDKPAMTIHRGLGFIPPNAWQFNEKNKLITDVLIIDEFSMVDIFIFKRILDAIDFNTTKLLIIGDNAQLPSVSCGNLLHDFMESNIIPTVTLTKIFRYGEGGLMKVATDTRFCKPYLNNIKSQFTWFGGNKDYAFINVDDSNMIKNSVALYKKLLSQGNKVEDIQVLSAYKKGDYGTITINNEIQKVANANYGSSDCMKVGETCYFVNDLVIQNVNNYKAKVFNPNGSVGEEETFIANGETGMIEIIYKDSVIINFDGIKVRYYRSDMQMIGLGYCITIHKSQGSSIKNVILLTPQSHTFMLNSNLIYVGLTRMKDKCFHLGNVNTVNNAIKKKANFVRNTNMQLLLKNAA